MPNWIDNRLAVKGPAQAVAIFVERAKGHDQIYQGRGEGKFQVLSFHALCPVPSCVLEMGYSQFGYRWELDHWGSKWGACNSSMEVFSPTKVVYLFETPFCPPVTLLGNLAAEFDDIQFSLSYEADEFVGLVRFRRGRLVKSRHRRKHTARMVMP